MNIMITIAIHGVQMKYLIRFLFLPLKLFLLTLAHSSCVAPAGQIQPHHALPKNNEERNSPANAMTSPAIIPSVAPIMIR